MRPSGVKGYDVVGYVSLTLGSLLVVSVLLRCLFVSGCSQDLPPPDGINIHSVTCCDEYPDRVDA